MLRRHVCWSATAIARLSGHVPYSRAKPIAFANGTSVMLEYGGNTMREAQLFYAPRFDLPLGGEHARLASDRDD